MVVIVVVVILDVILVKEIMIRLMDVTIVYNASQIFHQPSIVLYHIISYHLTDGQESTFISTSTSILFHVRLSTPKCHVHTL